MTHSPQPDADPVYHETSPDPKPDHTTDQAQQAADPAGDREGSHDQATGRTGREDEANHGQDDSAPELETVTLSRPPRVFALYRPEQVKERPEEGIAWWVLEVPDGSAYVLSADSSHHTLVSSQSLEHVERFWAPRANTDLVAITGPTPDTTT
ncbi:MAG: hypothetical protein GEU94_07335 [Micromonosporaceae bacterium]|nr:hypothetical protein [Micromonosporaceae bacterium]